MLSAITSGFREQFFVPAHIQGSDRAIAIREKVIEAIGSLLGMGGSVWMAFKIDGFEYAYLVFVVASTLLTRHFYRKKQGWLMVQQAVFTMVNLGGVYCWIVQEIS